MPTNALIEGLERDQRVPCGGLVGHVASGRALRPGADPDDTRFPAPPEVRNLTSTSQPVQLFRPTNRQHRTSGSGRRPSPPRPSRSLLSSAATPTIRELAFATRGSTAARSATPSAFVRYVDSSLAAATPRTTPVIAATTRQTNLGRDRQPQHGLSVRRFCPTTNPASASASTKTDRCDSSAIRHPTLSILWYELGYRSHTILFLLRYWRSGRPPPLFLRHHRCVRGCHRAAYVARHHTPEIHNNDLQATFKARQERFQRGRLSFPRPLHRQLLRLLNKLQRRCCRAW